ncbi:alpha/beta hydrolase [Staphylococcus equorum]|uniref:Alpha/beta hydrolase n=1 Tax=Staphylococcus equorum TaxID=246432 RepID=A0A9X4LF27_9STAP|nr:alpha/beta hydrolase [Staphylococcus equorum]MDG0842853.1 alpha/beta hydrolase [Staphylococcus equorum]MDG0859525.1 alpha/beta hydrolase [Staphylococcus equorum]
MNLFTTKDGVALNYRTSGEGNAIVMIHTALDNLSVYNEIENTLNKTHQVVLIDLRGHGYSDKPNDIEFKTYADDIKALLDYLYITECSFIGHELGGSVAVSFVAQYPEMATTLTLVNPTLLNEITPEERLYRKYADKVRNWEHEAQQKFFDKHLYYSKRKAKKFLKQVDDTNAIATKAELNAVKESFNDNNIMYYLGKVQLPTLIIVGQHGERTTVVEAKEVGDYIGDVSFEVFEESGLYPFIEQQEKFLNVVADFIKTNEKTKI